MSTNPDSETPEQSQDSTPATDTGGNGDTANEHGQGQSPTHATSQGTAADPETETEAEVDDVATETEEDEMADDVDENLESDVDVDVNSSNTDSDGAAIKDESRSEDASEAGEASDDGDTAASPEVSGPPERFQAAIRGGELKTAVKTLGAIVEETRIHIDEAGISMRAVDPANVAMDDLKLETAAFESYDATPGLIGVDLERFEDIVKMANKGDLIQLSLDQRTRKLLIHLDGLEFTMACLDPQTIRSEPELPNLDLPAEATVSCDALNRGVKAADMVSDHIYVEMDAETEQFLVEAEGDTDEISLELDGDDIEDVMAADARSLFSLDYMKDLVRSIPKGTPVRMAFGSNFPLIMTYAFADGDGQVTRMLAPRIQSD